MLLLMIEIITTAIKIKIQIRKVYIAFVEIVVITILTKITMIIVRRKGNCTINYVLWKFNIADSSK